MKNFKKVLAVVMALALIVTCFAACGKKNDSEKKNNNGQTSAEGGVLKIGFTGPLTGDYAQYGLAVQYGAQLAVDEINAAGGVNGMKLELLYQDDMADPAAAVTGYSKLIDDGMMLSLGSVTSGACAAFLGEALEDNMFMLTPSATAVEAIDGENAFRVCFSDPAQGTVSADYIKNNNLATNVAIIYDSSDAYSEGIYKKFIAQAKVNGLNVVTAESFTKNTKTDFSAQIQSVKKSGADLLFLPIYYNEASLILAQAKTAGLNVNYFGCDGLDGLVSMENFDKTLAENVMFLTPFSATATDELTANFVKNFKAKYGETYLNQFGADAYDAIYILKAAIEKVGINADMDASEICDALKTAITQISFTGVTGKNISWNADGEPVKTPLAVKIVNGAYVMM